MKRPDDVPLACITGSFLLGGSSTFLVNLAAAFGRRGQRLPIVSLSERNEHAADFARIGQPVHCVAGEKLIYEDRIARGYEELAREHPRAVLSCLGSESFEVLRLVPPGVVRLGIVQSHDPGPYGLVQRYARHLDVAVGVSREITRHLSAMPELRGVGVECIPYGIDFPPDVPARPSSPHNPLRVVYVGRLMEEQKRISRVAELIRRTRQAGLPVEFTFVGSGPEEPKLRAEFEHTADVTFTGALPNSEVRARLANQDVFVLLSDFEGLPLSLLEAMGQGVVPVVSDLPSGMRDVVNEECGFRVPVGDVAAAQETLAALCREPGRVQALAPKAAALARREYSADRMAERYLNLVAGGVGAEGAWPRGVEVPVPYGVRPWLFRGVMRRVRRALKPLRR